MLLASSRFCLSNKSFSGVAGGVVSQIAFQEHFGLVDENGKAIKSKVTNVSGNVVSVLQAGAFFGALGSAPISGDLLMVQLLSIDNRHLLFFSSYWTQMDFIRLHSGLCTRCCTSGFALVYNSQLI